MKQGKSLQELATELDRQNKTKRDMSVFTTALKVEDGRILKVGKDSEFPMTDHFHEQLASELEIPKKYYDKMRKEAPQLIDENANHWLKSTKEERFVRTLDGNARAYLSSKFRPLDNFDLAEVALPKLIESGCRVESCDVTEKKLYIKAVTERISFEVKKGDVVQAGIVISNSEVGCGSLKIEPMLLRLVCLNGAIMPDASIRKYHVGRGMKFDFEGATDFYRDETRMADDRALWMKVRDTVAAAFNQIDFEKLVARFSTAAEDRIELDPQTVVEITKKRFGMSELEGVSVLAHLMAGGDMSRFGLTNAVTRAAQDIKSYDRATDFERIGGEIIELPRTQWETIALSDAH